MLGRCMHGPSRLLPQQPLPQQQGPLLNNRRGSASRWSRASGRRRSKRPVIGKVFPFDVAWDVDQQSLASNIFATSIFPYAGFLYHLQKSKKAPGLLLFGFYFLLVFVAATIAAGVYAKLHYNSILANIDWLHGSAESFLTITNLLIVFGLRQGIQEAQWSKNAEKSTPTDASQREQEAASK